MRCCLWPCSPWLCLLWLCPLKQSLLPSFGHEPAALRPAQLLGLLDALLPALPAPDALQAAALLLPAALGAAQVCDLLVTPAVARHTARTPPAPHPHPTLTLLPFLPKEELVGSVTHPNPNPNQEELVDSVTRFCSLMSAYEDEEEDELPQRSS